MSRLHPAAAITTVCALSAAALLAVPLAATGAESGIRINEVESDGGTPGDWIEFVNTSSAPVDLTGYGVRDNKDDSILYTFPASTIVAPGAFLVIDQVDGGVGGFDFGLGKEDSVRLFDPQGGIVDETTWSGHSPATWGVQDIDGLASWAQTAESTRGAANLFSADVPDPGSIVINEVDSQPADWVEFFNPGGVALDISGYEIRDDSDDHRWQFPAGSTIEPGQYLMVEEGTIGVVDGVPTAFRDPIGIGGADRIRLFDATGAQIDDTMPWAAHAAIDEDVIVATFARCPDGVGDFVIARATPGATNAGSCVLPDVVINEIESNGDVTDWVEIANIGSTAVDVSGWSVMDNDPVGHASETKPLAAGTILEPGAYLVFDQNRDFVFGLGGGDTVTLRDGNLNVVDEHAYPLHADGVLARCEDGTGEFVDIAVSTKGVRNACGSPVRINEVESDGGSPDDWIEFVNPTASALDVSGVVVKDDDDTHAYVIPAGTTIAAAGYLVIERDQLGFGLGSGDSVRVFDGDLLVDSTSWGEGHAATTWGRCPDITGAFAVTAESTKGTANVCEGEIPVAAWPGSQDVRVLDSAPAFLADSSGLDIQETADGAFLWAVDNGEGRIWKLRVSADGSFSKISGWEEGKRVRFQKDAEAPGAAGPDTEGITVDGQGAVYVASERDNSAKGVNQNVVLKVDPEAAAGDLVAEQEWDLTALLPAVGANLGMEAVQWVPDSALDGELFDVNTGAAYDSADYAGHGDGLFFVAVEDNGHVYAFALAASGEATLISEIAPGLAGVMALDYDSVLDVLWAVCDNGCDGKSAQISLNGTENPGIAQFARPDGMPNINNEGFATAPASLAIDGQRPVWWFADGPTSEVLRTGTLPSPDSGNGGAPGNPGTPGGQMPLLPGTGLTDDNRNGVTVNPAVAARGSQVTVSAGADHAGERLAVWMYSEPVRLASGAASAAGAITVTIPTDAALGAHRIAVYSASGELLGWADIRITDAGGLAATGAELPVVALVAAGLLLVAGALIVRRRRRLA